MKPTSQNILCVRRAMLFKKLGVGQFEGFLPAKPDTIEKLIHDHGFYHKRTKAPDDPLENDFTIKQVIPQIFLVWKDKVCCHRIPETGGEARLHNKVAVPFGGHIEEGDADIWASADREFGEEVICDSVFLKLTMGVVNVDEVDLVSKAHVGIVMIYVCREPVVKNAKDEGVDGESLQFLTLDELEARKESLTAWSVACLPMLREFMDGTLNKESPFFMEPPKNPVEVIEGDEPITGLVIGGAPGERVELPLEAIRSEEKGPKLRHLLPASIMEAVGQLAGSASMCWEPRPSGQFLTSEATEFVEKCLDVIAGEFFKENSCKPLGEK